MAFRGLGALSPGVPCLGPSSLSQFYLSTPQGQAQEAGALRERLPPAEPVPGPGHEASAAHPTDEEWGSEQRGRRARSPQPVRARARPRPCEIPEGLRRTPAPRGRLGNAAASAVHGALRLARCWRSEQRPWPGREGEAWVVRHPGGARRGGYPVQTAPLGLPDGARVSAPCAQGFAPVLARGSALSVAGRPGAFGVGAGQRRARGGAGSHVLPLDHVPVRPSVRPRACRWPAAPPPRGSRRPGVSGDLKQGTWPCDQALSAFNTQTLYRPLGGGRGAAERGEERV